MQPHRRLDFYRVENLHIDKVSDERNRPEGFHTRDGEIIERCPLCTVGSVFTCFLSFLAFAYALTALDFLEALYREVVRCARLEKGLNGESARLFPCCLCDDGWRVVMGICSSASEFYLENSQAPEFRL
ncbi:hypothetical protein BT93_A2387 [Corymbia citriodora subsp. variegata]|nr:hypothetical protein BT93_A2387 [Corymbia citriodora subsp. variegata]